MRLNWKGRGRKINGDYIIDWDWNGVDVVWYRIYSLKTGKTILEINVL